MSQSSNDFFVGYLKTPPKLAAFLAVVTILLIGLGIGGGFIMVPAMIYMLGMRTSMVVGTSLLQIIFVTANVTFLQAISTQTVDVVLAILLLIGAVVGAQFGSQFAVKLKGEQLRGLLALLVVSVCLKLAFDLVVTPDDIFSIVVAHNG